MKYNADGDLIFTAAKDAKPMVWYSDSGERLGTYGVLSNYIHLLFIVLSSGYHKGAVWDLDPNWDSKYLVTACADGFARLFEVTTGNYITKMPHRGAVRSVSWAEGTHFFATAADPFTSRETGSISIFTFPTEDVLVECMITLKRPVSTCFIVVIAANRESPEKAPSHTFSLEIPVDPLNKATCLGWTVANSHIVAGFDNGLIMKFDVETGKEVQQVKVHTDRVNRISFNNDKTLMITASKDKTSKLIDPVSLEVLKVYTTPTPVNGAVISPTHPHVLIGGGQEAMQVTVTGHQSGKFETRFFHMIYEEEFGRVKGHFGPINALAIHPYGKSYASGSEDGCVVSPEAGLLLIRSSS